MWKTGAAAYDDDAVKQALGFEPHDAIVGFLYLGTEAGHRRRGALAMAGPGALPRTLPGRAEPSGFADEASGGNLPRRACPSELRRWRGAAVSCAPAVTFEGRNRMRLLCCVAALCALAACASKTPEEKSPCPPLARRPRCGDSRAARRPKAGDRRLRRGPARRRQARQARAMTSSRMPTVPGTQSFTIPPDTASFGPFDRLDELSKERVRSIIEQSAAAHAASWHTRAADR